MADDRDDATPAATLGGDESSDIAEVPADLQRTFWVLVALANVALFAASLGLMLVVFRGRVTLGGASLLVGLVAFAIALRRYPRRND